MLIFSADMDLTHLGQWMVMKSIIIRAMKILSDFVYASWQTSINNRSKLLNSKDLGKGKSVN